MFSVRISYRWGLRRIPQYLQLYSGPEKGEIICSCQESNLQPVASRYTDRAPNKIEILSWKWRKEKLVLSSQTTEHYFKEEK
jgi:hypothetical protein